MKLMALLFVGLLASCAREGNKSGQPVPAQSEVSEDTYVRYLHYAEGTAPYLIRAREIAADPGNNSDPKRIAAAYGSDPLMKSYPAESSRLMKLYKLTPDDVSKYAPLLADAEPLVSPAPGPGARSAFITAHSEPNTRIVEDHAEETRSTRKLLSAPAPQLPIDCGRQRFSCACVDCGHSCETPAADEAYRSCTQDCIGEAAKCAIEALGVASFVCAIPFSICMDKCNRNLGASCS
jgi:hypothetical protein